MKKALLLAAAIVCSSAAIASDWVLVGKNEVGEFYFDRQSIYVVDTNMRRAWMMLNKDVPDHLPTLSMKVLREFDCHQRRHRDIQATTYSARMGRGESHTFPIRPPRDDWSYPPPDTPSAMFLAGVCAPREASLKR